MSDRSISLVSDLDRELRMERNKSLEILGRTSKRIIEYISKEINEINFVKLQINKEMTKSSIQIKKLVKKIETVILSILQAENKSFPFIFTDPADMLRTIFEIENSLPIGYRISVNYRRYDLLELYKSTSCNVATQQLKLLVICDFSISNKQDGFRMFEMFSIPFPVSNTSYFFQIENEFKFFGLSKDQTRYFLEDDNIEKRCNLKSIPLLCNHQFIIRSTQMNSCSLANYMENNALINKECQTKIIKENKILIQRIGREKYIITSLFKEEIRINFECKTEKNSKFTYIKGGYHGKTTTLR